MAWCAAWTEEKKAAELRVYRARCLLRCLEANLDRINPEQFDELMTRIEAARNELSAAFYANLSVPSSNDV